MSGKKDATTSAFHPPARGRGCGESSSNGFQRQQLAYIAVTKSCSFLSVGDGFRAVCACRLWNLASEHSDAWQGFRLTARRPSESIFADERQVADEQVDSITALSDETLLRLVRKLRRVSEAHDLETVPPACASGAPRSRQTPLNVRRYDFGGHQFWFLRYNTEVYGWFDREHTNTFPCGFKVWTPTPLMCRWFSRGDAGASIDGCSVIELGSGMGLLGISMSVRAARVVITDIDPSILRIVAANAAANGATNVVVERLGYGSDSAAGLRGRYGRFDRVVGADIVYSATVIRPIFESVHELLTEDGSFSLGFVDRSENFLGLIRAAAEEFGFVESQPPRVLVKVLGDVADEEEEPRTMLNTGMLAELQKMVKRLERLGECVSEQSDKAQLLEFRRRYSLAAPASAPPPAAERITAVSAAARLLVLDEMD